MLKNYLKIAWRNLWKNKAFSLINILGLSIGISVSMAILIFVLYQSTFDTHHKKADRTYRVVQENKLPDQTLHWNITPYPMAEALRNDFPEVEIVSQTMGLVSREFGIYDGPDIKKFKVSRVLFVDTFFPKVFDFEWIVGNPDNAFSDINSIVLTEDIARKYFGDINNDFDAILGKTVLLDGKDPLRVTGILKNVPGNSNQRFDILIPYGFFKASNPDFALNWSGNHQGTTFLVLPNADMVKSLVEKFTSWKKIYLDPDADTRISYFLQPLRDVHINTLYGSGPGSYVMPSQTLKILSALAFFILTIAIINFINLQTARSISRSKEVGIRKVLGSRRLDLIAQFLFENCLMILFALVLSMAVLKILIKQMNQNLTVMDLHLFLGPEEISLILVIGLVTVILAAIYPSLVQSAFKPITALTQKAQLSKLDGVGSRKVLVTFQFVLVQLFVIAAIVIALQMDYFKDRPVGFFSDAVVMTPVPDFDKMEVYKQSLLATNNIVDVTIASGPPMAVDDLQLGTMYRLPEQSENEAMEAEIKVGDSNYLKFYELELLAGRTFINNKEAFDEFLVNQSLLKPFGWNPQEAIGKKIQTNEGQGTIVGVVKDFNNNSLQYAISPCIIMNWTFFQNQAFIKIGTNDPGALEKIKQIWESTFTEAVFHLGFLDDSIAREYGQEELIFKGFRFLAMLAIILGCFGLLGLISFMLSKRKKEIGIRKVLGANLLQIFSHFNKEFLGLLFVSFAIAAPIVYYFTTLWLENFAYRIELSVWVFLGGGLLTASIVMISCSFQLLKAARANPVKSLRTE